MNRKTFIKKTAGALLLSIPAASLINCSDDKDDMDPDPMAEANCLENGTNSSIGANHGHSITVPVSDVMSGTEKSYSIQGTSAHNHDVVVTAAMFTSLQSNQQVQASSSSGDGHVHSVTIRCA